MSKAGRVKHISLMGDIGRPLKYEQYRNFGHKRLYWDTPNKNYGFLTSEQMEEHTRRFKTEGSYQASPSPSPYRIQKAGKFIVNTQNPEEVHCCTCHNNPQRYFKNAERCKFCEQYGRKNRDATFSLGNSSKGKKHETETRKPVDQMIQVSLPRVHHHNSKHEDRCQACKMKNKSRQNLNSPKSALFQQSPKKVLQNHLEGSYRNGKWQNMRNFKSQLHNDLW